MWNIVGLMLKSSKNPNAWLVIVSSTCGVSHSTVSRPG